jgi:transcriptional regulator with XRE-family HTH domain
MDKSTHTAAYDRLTAALKKAREDVGMTQQQVAERLEVYASWVSKVESGERRIDVVELAALCEVYGLGLVEMLRTAGLVPAEV